MAERSIITIKIDQTLGRKDLEYKILAKTCEEFKRPQKNFKKIETFGIFSFKLYSHYIL